MPESKPNERLDVFIAILIALVSLSTALAAWRTANLGSQAGDLNVQALIETVKRQALANENWRQAYQEAGHARDYLVALAGLEALEAAGSPADLEYAAQARLYLLPGLETMAAPLGTDQAYQTEAGGLDIPRRFEDLQRDSADPEAIDPQEAFDRADRFYAEQRWLAVGTILMALSLFWLGLSQLSHLRLRLPVMVLGALLYAVGLAWCLVVEIAFALLRGGA